jgi:hypothetical protein
VVDTGAEDTACDVDAVVVPGVGADAEVDDPLVPEPDPVDVVGDGETIVAVEADADDDAAGVEGEGAVADDVPADVVVVELDELANGLREGPAMATLTDLRFLVDVDLTPVEAGSPAAGACGVDDGGGGVAAAPSAEPPFNRSIGTATTAAISSATTIHSLRSIRSRRSELMECLRSWRRPRWLRPPTGRSWPTP